jgi:hypothetical protein
MSRAVARITAAGFVALASGAGAWAAQAATPWLHVRVEEPRREAKVSVNLPLPVVEAALKAAPERIVSGGRIHLGHHDHGLSLAEMRRLWKELRNTGDAELVSVEEKDETVHVARVGDLVQVRVSKAGGGEEVHVDVPVSLVDALLSGDDETVNVDAAMAEVAKLRGDVVRVKDDDSQVRVWIDEVN